MTNFDREAVRHNPVRPRAEWLDGVKQGLLIGAAILAVLLPPATIHVLPQAGAAVQSSSVRAAPLPAWPKGSRLAEFGDESASLDVRQLANWIVDSGDNQNRFFVLVDKKETKVFLFDAAGKIVGATPVLIGAAVGDDSVVGIGSRPIAEVQPHERTTPAGRFEGERGRNTGNEDIVWVDYDAAVSMHRVRANEPAERRLQRLASATAEDNRISYGCINMPVAFYENVISPAFSRQRGVVYVLPELKSLGDVFTQLYDVEAEQARRLASKS